jgi:hypothetical protein
MVEVEAEAEGAPRVRLTGVDRRVPEIEEALGRVVAATP